MVLRIFMMASGKIALMLLAASTVSAREFLAAKRRVDTASVQHELEGVLQEVLGHGHGVASARLNLIRTRLEPMCRALPKNQRGHFSSHVMRYAVRRYFSQNHGWIVKGFEQHGETFNSSNSSTALGDSMLQTKLPGFIRSVMEQRFAHQGFSLDALVAMVASLEQLVFDEVVKGVESSFDLNAFEHSDALNSVDLKEILSSFLIIDMLEGSDDKEKHANDKKNIRKRYPFWDTTVLYLMDVVNGDIYDRRTFANPFAGAKYGFEDAVRMAQRVSEEFGSWSNYECHEMKDMLIEMDQRETGRVKLSEFYRYSRDGAWQFLEPSEQLRQLGALDESSSWLGPQVMISNYITSMSNCITSGPYYSICCLNECNHVFQHLESYIGAPRASASDILLAMESFYQAPNITDVLRSRLNEVERVSGEQIPLHGRLFAQWLHFAFPRECPYPHAPGVLQPLSGQWREDEVSGAEIDELISSEYAKQVPSPDAGSEMWTLEENLLVASTPSDVTDGLFWSLLRVGAQGGMLLSLILLIKPLIHTLWQPKIGEIHV